MQSEGASEISKHLTTAKKYKHTHTFSEYCRHRNAIGKEEKVVGVSFILFHVFQVLHTVHGIVSFALHSVFGGLRVCGCAAIFSHRHQPKTIWQTETTGNI